MGKVEQLSELVLLVDRLEYQFDIDELVLDQVQFDESIIGLAEV